MHIVQWVCSLAIFFLIFLPTYLRFRKRRGQSFFYGIPCGQNIYTGSCIERRTFLIEMSSLYPIYWTSAGHSGWYGTESPVRTYFVFFCDWLLLSRWLFYYKKNSRSMETKYISEIFSVNCQGFPYYISRIKNVRYEDDILTGTILLSIQDPVPSPSARWRGSGGLASTGARSAGRTSKVVWSHAASNYLLQRRCFGEIIESKCEHDKVEDYSKTYDRLWRVSISLDQW